MYLPPQINIARSRRPIMKLPLNANRLLPLLILKNTEAIYATQLLQLFDFSVHGWLAFYFFHIFPK
jgi:hypothetical protein